MKNRINQNKVVIAMLILTFSLYNIIIYTQESNSTASTFNYQALQGQKIWQDNNCTSCHQLYGLGGYLAPDLTNIISNPQKGEMYARSFLNSGVKSMPEFNFSEEEKDHIIQFLSHVDKTGFYPNKEAEFGKDGWVTIKYK